MQPLETRSPRGFAPPFCPRSDCARHHPDPHQPFPVHRHGVYLRASDGRVVPRFRCPACRRTFSLQTFAFSYYLKRAELSIPIAAGLLAGSAHRQIARSLACSPSTVTRRSARLGRHALLLSLLALAHLPRLREPVVLDHFESFAISQDAPLGLATAVGRDSWFLYLLDPAPHRRARRRTAGRRSPRHPPPPPAPGTYTRSTTRVLDHLAARIATPPLALITDDHPAYRGALARHPHRHRFGHHVYPNPPRRARPRTPEARRRDCALFPVDLLHALIRHSTAHHRRETIAFSRRLNALLERAYLLGVWRNFVKRRSERRLSAATPAMHLGLTSRPWDWSRVLAQRLFPTHRPMPPECLKIYRRTCEVVPRTPARPHALKLAF